MSVAIDITKDDNNNIQSISEYRGYSLQSTCSTEENYFIGKEYDCCSVSRIDLPFLAVIQQTTQSQPTWLHPNPFCTWNWLKRCALEVFDVQRDWIVKRATLYRFECPWRITHRELNCTYFRQPLFGMENQTVPIMNTTYVLLAGDGTYVLPHWNDVVSQRCEDCSCDLNVGYTARRQFWTSNLLYTSIIVVVCSLDLLWKYIKHKWQWLYSILDCFLLPLVTWRRKLTFQDNAVPNSPSCFCSLFPYSDLLQETRRRKTSRKTIMCKFLFANAYGYKKRESSNHLPSCVCMYLWSSL